MAPMRAPLIRQGEGLEAALDRFRREHEQLRRKPEEIARMPAPELDARRHGRGAAGGDRARLRGLPAIGPSVSGAMADTQPEADVIRRLGSWSGRSS